MKKDELLVVLHTLKEKISRCDELEKKIEQNKDRIEHNEAAVTAQVRPEKIPKSVPELPQYYPEGCNNIERYDNTHKPKEIKDNSEMWAALTVILLYFIIFIVYIFITEPEFDFDVYTVIFEGIVGLFVFVIPLAIVWNLIVKLYEKINLSINNKREQKYLRDYADRRNTVYKDDLDANQAAIDSYFDTIRKLNDEITDCKKNIAIIEKQLKDSRAIVNADTCIPSAYKKTEIINKIIEYLENFRADSLKEAINLYEYETAMEKHNSSMRRAAWESALQAGRQADAMRETAEHQAQLAYEAQRQRQAAEKAAESARKAAESNEEALNIIKEWDKNSD